MNLDLDLEPIREVLELCKDFKANPHPGAQLNLGAATLRASPALARLLQPEGEIPDYRGFAHALFELTDWPHNAGDIDGFDFQECAERNGLLKIEKRIAPCGDDCGCAEYTDGEVNCYRKHPDLLSAAPSAGSEKEDK